MIIDIENKKITYEHSDFSVLGIVIEHNDIKSIFFGFNKPLLPHDEIDLNLHDNLDMVKVCATALVINNNSTYFNTIKDNIIKNLPELYFQKVPLNDENYIINVNNFDGIEIPETFYSKNKLLEFKLKINF